jgi:hypothetical protein
MLEGRNIPNPPGQLPDQVGFLARQRGQLSLATMARSAYLESSRSAIAEPGQGTDAGMEQTSMRSTADVHIEAW